MANPFVQLSNNGVFLVTMFAWTTAQMIKIIIGVKKERRFNFKWIFEPGGMPSAHTATVSALATSVGIYFGFGSGLFAVTLIFAIMIMFDAAGLRRSVGKQAGILNRIVDDVYRNKKIEEQKLRELLGHTPIEVIAGAGLGILIAMVLTARLEGGLF
ncbi:MAG: divergent PAP2 family protein [Candidatus Omnitrophota bacterium]|nr:divergent PAP2 family protein [Candidatus Omnitrophota bacterium]